MALVCTSSPQAGVAAAKSGATSPGFILDDGGRAAAGYKGLANDCVARSVAIASGLPYDEVYAALSAGAGSQRRSKHARKRVASARKGIHTGRKWFKNYMAGLGFEWVPTMHIGAGCKVHLVADELPGGRLVVALSRHYTAMIDGVIHDTFDPRRSFTETRGGTRQTYERCVYGYWRLTAVSAGVTSWTKRTK